MKNTIVRFGVIIPCLIISILTIFDIAGSTRIILLSLGMILYILFTPEDELSIIFFFVGFAADIGVSFAGVPYITILQLVFVCKLLIRKGIKSAFLLFVLGIIITQMYAILFCDLNIIRLVTFILNLLLMYCVGYAIDAKEDVLQHYYSAFILGIAVVLLASIRRDITFFSGVYYRFKGIWPDQNFLAMFCGIAGLLVYYSWIKEKRHYFLACLLLPLFFYCGYRTYSMTFIFCVALVLGLLFADICSSKIHLFIKLLIIVAVSALGIYVFSAIYSGVIAGRGREIYVAGTDWSHGRFTDTGIVLGAWKQNIGSILFGIGINNSNDYTQFVAHNTYAEIVAQTGLIGSLMICVLIVKFCSANLFKIKYLFTLKIGFVVVLLFYMATLSMEATDVLYLLFGMGINRIRQYTSSDSSIT